MRTRQSPRVTPSLQCVFLLILLAALWLAGGASKADVSGQIISRAAATIVLVMVVLFGERSSLVDCKAIFWLLLAAIGLPLVQLVPLPPAIWQGLPGREILTRAAQLSGESQPWRPISMVPGATLNAAGSLIVPAAVLFCLSGISPAERLWMPAVILVIITLSMMVGLIQFSGSRFNQPLINYTRDVSGTFANRNHFALFMVVGCLVTPVWALAGHRKPGWRLSVAAGLVLLLVLTILASGSRAGLVGAALSLLLGPMIVREDLRYFLRGRPRWVLPVGIASLLAVIASFVALSISLGRAVSINRIVGEEVGQDMRSRGLSTIFTMINHYSPVGTGLGSFDPLFRLNEPFELLKLTYFNQSHNDFLGIVLDAGLPGLVLILLVLAWWICASFRVWRSTNVHRQGPPSVTVVVGRLGSAVLLVLFLASIVDYPARTPLIMALVITAGCWLAWGSSNLKHTNAPARMQRI